MHPKTKACLIFLLLYISTFSFSMEPSLLSVPKGKEPAGVIGHNQEREFHTRLMDAHKELSRNRVLAYYKKIIPITSTPSAGLDQWDFIAVYISGKKVIPDANGVYTHGNISFSINPPAYFDPTQAFNITVMHNEKCENVRFAKHIENKTLAFPHFDGYKDVLDAAANNNLFLMQEVTLKGMVRISKERPCVILIECENQRTLPITIRGMEVVCNKDNGITSIFFDFADDGSNPVDYFNPIQCKHGSLICDQNVFCIKEHEFYECKGKKIYGFFDSPETRKKWIPDETGFYDQNRSVLICLPSCYGDPNDHQETLKQPMTWVFEEGHNSFYKLVSDKNLDDAKIFKNTNKYICSANGLFFVTLPYKATFKECLSNNNTIDLYYLVQVLQPSLSLRKNVIVKRGQQDVPTGFYEVIRKGKKAFFISVEGSVDDTITFPNGYSMDAKWPTDGLDAQQAQKWCNAAQRCCGSFTSFQAKIRCCNQNLVSGFKKWDELTALTLSHVQLKGGLQWGTLLDAIGSMTQLVSFAFVNNHPITDFFKPYKEQANAATEYYLALGTCLSKLTKLKELHIQGLWLKPHKFLGSGCEDWVSTEVAVLTGIINHKKQVGIRAIIGSVCALKNLETLSIDGIPNHGSSPFSRASGGQKLIFFPFFVATSVAQVMDGDRQEADLKQLVIVSSYQLARMCFLKTISVYSPGGNCVDYFSKAFRKGLANARYNIKPALPTLTINALELQ